MALIRCPDCDRSVSDAAPTCPGCGRPISDEKPSPPVVAIELTSKRFKARMLWGWGIFFLGLVVGSLLLWLGLPGWPGAVISVAGVLVYCSAVAAAWWNHD